MPNLAHGDVIAVSLRSLGIDLLGIEDRLALVEELGLIGMALVRIER